MIDAKLIEEFSARLSRALADSPVKDLEKNAKAMLSGALSRLDLVSREEFEIQKELLARSRERLEALEARVRALESGR